MSGLRSLTVIAFKAIKILSTLIDDVPINRSFQCYQNTVNCWGWHSFQLVELTNLVFTATPHVEDAMLRVNYRNWQHSFQSYQNPVNCQCWHSRQLSQLTTVAYRANWNLEDVCFLTSISVEKCSFQGYLKPGRRYVSHQRSELKIVAFIATKILSILRADNPVNCSFQSYQNPVNFLELTFLSIVVIRTIKILSTVRVDNPVNRSFQSYQNPGNCHSWHSCELSELENEVDIGVDNERFQSYLKTNEDAMLLVNCLSWQPELY